MPPGPRGSAAACYTQPYRELIPLRLSLVPVKVLILSALSPPKSGVAITTGAGTTTTAGGAGALPLPGRSGLGEYAAEFEDEDPVEMVLSESCGSASKNKRSGVPWTGNFRFLVLLLGTARTGSLFLLVVFGFLSTLTQIIGSDKSMQWLINKQVISI